MRRYLEVHRFEDDLEQQLRAGRELGSRPYTGHAEAWFDRAELALVGSTPEGKRAMQVAVEDEANFIDFANSAIWLAKEQRVHRSALMPRCRPSTAA